LKAKNDRTYKGNALLDHPDYGTETIGILAYVENMGLDRKVVLFESAT
jgi:hypothetical protein